jgi:hypothetical protein
VNAVCNYDSPEDAAQAISEAIEYNVLLHAGEMELIWEGFGPAQHKEALRQVACLIRSGTWERLVAADNLRKAEKTAARERATARATVLESERAATIASLADWDATYNTANPIGLSSPTSHMVSRGLVQSELLIGKLKNRLGGHNIGLAPELLDDVMKAITATIRDYATKSEPRKGAWWTKEGGGTPSAGAHHIRPEQLSRACQRSVSRTLRRQAAS